MNIDKKMYNNIVRYKRVEGGNLAYYGLLFYTIIFFSQIAARFPALAPFRPEFVLGAILTALSVEKIISGRVDLSESKLNYLILIFFVVALFNIPLALIKSDALGAFIGMVKFFCIYLMIISTIDNEKKLKCFIYIYVTMVAFLFVQPFLLSLYGKGFIYNNHMWRLAGVTGYFGHPNQLGGISAANLPFFYFLMKYEKSLIKKVILLALIIIALRVIMLTQSRTAFIGVLSFGFLILFFSKRKFLTFILVLFLGILTWQFSPPETKDRFLTFTDTFRVMTGDSSEVLTTVTERRRLGSMVSRWELMKRGFIVFKDNPMFGVGIECFRSVNGRRWGYWFPPHCTYIQALAEMGIIGFLSFLLMIIFMFLNLRESKRLLIKMNSRDNFLLYLNYAVTIYILQRLVVGMFSQDLYEYFWWVAGGLSLVMLRICKMKQEEYEQNELLVRSR